MTKYRIYKSNTFLKCARKINSGVGGKKIIQEVSIVIDLLASGHKLESYYKDHALNGEYEGYRECHVRGDLLLVYRIEKDTMILILKEIGSHSYLF